MRPARAGWLYVGRQREDVGQSGNSIRGGRHSVIPKRGQPFGGYHVPTVSAFQFR